MKFNSKKMFITTFVAVFFVIFVYLKQSYSDAISTEDVENGKSVQIVTKEPEKVAFRLTKSFKRGEVVNIDDVEFVGKLAQVPDKYKINIDNDIIKTIENGAVIDRDIEQGQYVRESNIISFEDEDILKYIIKPGNDGFIVKSDLIHVPIQQFYVGQKVDIIAITSSNTNLAQSQNIVNNTDLNSLDDVKVKRIIKGVEVVSINKRNNIKKDDTSNNYASDDVTSNDDALILSVTSRQFNKLLIAQKVSSLEVVPSSEQNIERNIESIIDNYKDVTELRG